jgi:phosphatidylglycerol:prolipoprotein diacylglycerol transferase
MFPTLQIGPLALPAAPLTLILSIWLGLSLSEKFSQRRGLNVDALSNLVLITILSGIVGARLFFAAQNFSAFVQTPLSLFSRETGSLDPLGGFASALIAALIYGQRAKLKFWPTLDGLTPLFAVFAVGLGVSRLASGSAFGAETSLPWGIELWGAIRHPTQVYEIVLALGILLFLGWKTKSDSRTDDASDGESEAQIGVPVEGRLFLLFVALTAGAQLFVEGFRGDSVLLPGGLRAGQVLAWLVMAAALLKANFFTDRQTGVNQANAATRHG